LDADTLQDPIVAAGRTWTLAPLTSKLVLDGLAKVEVHETKVAGRRVKVKVTWLRITEAGRKAIAE
jgi:hypothetical protein